MNVFEFVKAINAGKKDTFTDEQIEKEYVPFVINKAFSFHIDTVLYAAEMNRNHQLSKGAQFAYYLSTVKPRKRYGWVKAERNEDLDVIQKVYQVGVKKARTILPLLSKDQLNELRKTLESG